MGLDQLPRSDWTTAPAAPHACQGADWPPGCEQAHCCVPSMPAVGHVWTQNFHFTPDTDRNADMATLRICVRGGHPNDLNLCPVVPRPLSVPIDR